tara:strand:- start:4842 stop:8813 length:3972 start_codon:yes stop_codon:yes gene_type:complete
MATARNVFIKSKMNKDLDDRLLGKGEYRDALNVNISKSEASDVGALENVLGNKLITNLGLTGKNLEIIGYYADEFNDNIYFFITDYCDTSSDGITNFAPFGSTHKIISYNINTGSVNTLCSGRFLNFSTTNRIENVDVIEDLIFWTDNRNQPRKINTTKALSDPNFYNNEDKISVTKYYPYSTPKVYESFEITGYSTPTNATNFHVAGGTLIVSDSSILRAGDYIKLPAVNNQTGVIRIKQIYSSTAVIITSNVPADLTFGSSGSPATITILRPTSADKTSKFTSPSIYAKLAALPNVANPMGFIQINGFDMPPYPGMELSSPRFEKGTTVVSINQTTAPITVQFTPAINNSPQRFEAGDFVTFSDPNSEYDANFPGDKLAIEDKFIRLAYRFRFNDNEYSLVSPFTQPIFIPKQDGYFSTFFNKVGDRDNLISQETQTVNNTIINWFENKVNQTQLDVEMPVAVNQLSQEFDVKQIQIIYKESDGLAFRVLETIEIEDNRIANNSTKNFKYTYQGKKPVRTLPESDTVRVFDKSPLRAQTQSVSGNRVIYGNFIDKATPPNELDFYVGVSPKFGVQEQYTCFSTVAYPNHTLKQNRTYQVGIVLADRYGRQSDVIVSKFKSQTIEFPVSSGNFFGGSTVYAPYLDSSVDIRTWFGNSLKLLWQSAIPENINTPGYPGLYRSGKYTVTVDSTTNNVITISESIPVEVSVGDILVAFPSGNQTFLSIKSFDYANKTITVNENISLNQGQQVDIYGQANPLGWYTYKVVVKQLAQPYYNLYLPPALAGNPTFKRIPTGAITPSTNTIANGVSKQYYNAEYSYTGTTGSGAEFRVSVGGGGTVATVFVTVAGSGYKSGDTFVFDTTQFGTSATPATGDLVVTLTSAILLEDPAPNELTSSFITLLSDNINKLPPDLAEVTPEQTQFRTSDDILFPRTASPFPTGTSGDPANLMNGVQYYLGTDSFNVGNYAKLNATTLPTTTTPRLVAKGIFKATSNPTTAELVTTGDGFGAVSDSSIFPGEVGADFNIERFGQPLSVLEVQPPFSNIDIYYETSTVGLISELNQAINDASVNDTPFEIRINKQPPQQGQSYAFNESRANLTDVIAGPFYSYNASGALLSNATMSLSSVFDTAGNNVTNEFSLVADSGGYSLLCSVRKYYGANASLRNWTYNILVENVSLGITYSNTLSETGGLSNTAPSLNNAPNNQSTSGTTGIVNPATGGSSAYIEALNGAVGQSERQQEIAWSVSASIGTTDYSSKFDYTFGSNGDIDPQNPANLNRLRYTNLTVVGTYTVVITVTDGGGATASHTFSFTKNNPEQEGSGSS